MLRTLLLVGSIFIAVCASGQKVKLTGKVVNDKGNPIIGANLFFEENGYGTTSDSLGSYVIELAPGSYGIVVSHISYFTKRQRVILREPLFLDFQLNEKVQELEEVEVRDRAPDHNVNSLEVGVSNFAIKEIKKMPAFMGEVDVMKSLMFLPGVTTVGEGSSNINVRGGNSDQNLILIEGTPIFNPSHLMGLLSVFNPDATSGVTLYRGNVPATFGGRASSVLDIGVRKPDVSKMHIEGGIGLVANRLLLETPIHKNKGSLLFASRISFPDYLFKISGVSSIQSTVANFYDFTVRGDYNLNRKNRLTVFGYLSSDKFKPAGDSISSNLLGGDIAFQWQTKNIKAEWNHAFSERFSVSTSGVLANYSTTISSQTPIVNAFSLRSDLMQINAKSIFAFETPTHKVKAGFEGIHYTIRPGNLLPNSDSSSVKSLTLNTEQSYELAGFFSDELQINKWISVMYGIRYSQFYNMGPASVYSYNSTQPRSIDSITDTTRVGEGKVVKSYGGWEPRGSLNFKISKTSSIKIGYSRLRQYIQRITNTTSVLPTDRWQTSNTYIRPTVSDQISAGYFRNFRNNKWESSIEFYMKNITDVTDYRDGANLLLNQATETALLQGQGRARGIEFQIKKNSGRLTGWLNYTYSQTEILINGQTPTERINNGNWYPANYNKPNILNLSTSYSLTKRTLLSMNFTYSSGRPVTFPTNQYYIGNIQVPNYTTRNQNNIPDYHRLDVSLTVEPNPEKKSKVKCTWIFSIYNVYARKNAFSVFTRTSSLIDTYQLSIFGTIFPSITCNFKIL